MLDTQVSEHPGQCEDKTVTDTRKDIIEARRRARARARTTGSSYQSELEYHARQQGYDNWKGMLAGDALPKRSISHPYPLLTRVDNLVMQPFLGITRAIGPNLLTSIYLAIQIICVSAVIPLAQGSSGTQGATLIAFAAFFVMCTIGSFILNAMSTWKKERPALITNSEPVFTILMVAISITQPILWILRPNPTITWYAQTQFSALMALGIIMLGLGLALPFARATRIIRQTGYKPT